MREDGATVTRNGISAARRAMTPRKPYAKGTRRGGPDLPCVSSTHHPQQLGLVDASAEHIVGAHLHAGKRVPLRSSRARRACVSPHGRDREVSSSKWRFAETLRVQMVRDDRTT